MAYALFRDAEYRWVLLLVEGASYNVQEDAASLLSTSGRVEYVASFPQRKEAEYVKSLLDDTLVVYLEAAS
jgi:hypothetical protein